MPKYASKGFRTVEAASLRDAAAIFALRYAKRLFRSGGKVSFLHEFPAEDGADFEALVVKVRRGKLGLEEVLGRKNLSFRVLPCSSKDRP